MLSLVLLVIAANVIVLITIAVHRVYLHPLAIVPGPKLWSLSRLPWLWHTVRGDLWQALERLHTRYGDTIRIAPNEITTRSASAWQEIYVARPLLLKDPHSQTPPLNGAHSLFTAEGETHKRIRGVLAHAFSDKALREQAITLELHASRFIARLRKELRLDIESIVDINKFYGFITFDTITDLAYGESTNCLQDDGDHQWIRRFFLHAQYSTVSNSLRWFSPLDKVLDFLVLGITRKTRERNWVIIAEKIQRRLAQDEKIETRSDLLTPVIGRVTKDNSGLKKGLSRAEVLSYAMSVVIADSQITSAALTSSTYLLCRHPWAWDQICQEVRQTFTSEDQITVQSTQGLVFLEAVLNETLRLHHPSPVALPRVIPPRHSRHVGEFQITGKAIVGISLQNIQLSPNYWVEPRLFHPERFLPPSHACYDPKFDQDNKAAFIPFSTGPRNCIGAKLFFAQARLALAKLIWNFDMELVDDEAESWLNHKVFIVLEPKRLQVKLVGRLVD